MLFAGEAEVATPPTTDHALVDEAVDEAGLLPRLRRHRDRRRDRRGRQGRPALGRPARQIRLDGAAGARARVVPDRGRPPGEHARLDPLPLGRPPDARPPQPLQGADRARAAGIPVYTVALGTTGNTTLRGYPAAGFPGGGTGFGRRGLLARSRRRCTRSRRVTGGKFYRAKSAGAVQDAYSSLGSKLGRKPGTTEVTDLFLTAAAGLLVLAGVLSALWSPRFPYDTG